MGNLRSIKIDEEVIELIKECREEFIRVYPEMEGLKISRNAIIMHIAKIYLGKKKGRSVL